MLITMKRNSCSGPMQEAAVKYPTFFRYTFLQADNYRQLQLFFPTSMHLI